MKRLSKHMKESLDNEAIKNVFPQKTIGEELDTLTRMAPINKTEKKQTKSLIDSVISGG